MVVTNYLSMTDGKARILTDSFRSHRRLFRKAIQQGHSKRRGEAYPLRYVEPLSAARTMLADFLNSLLDEGGERRIHHWMTDELLQPIDHHLFAQWRLV